MSILEKLGREVILFDGAMGTRLQEINIESGIDTNFKHSEAVIEIHRSYIDAGADIITSNTFNCNRIKARESEYSLEQLIAKAFDNAKKASGTSKNLIALGLTSIGELLEPLGSLSFDEAYDIYREQILLSLKYEPDLILFETMTDLYEVKAGVLAAKENSKLPIFVTMTYEKDGRTFLGSSLLSQIMTLEALGVDCIGVNCSLGPYEMDQLVGQLVRHSSLPIIIQANNGRPETLEGRPVYKLGAGEYFEKLQEFVNMGVAVVGGCCGTGVSHILALKELKGRQVRPRRTEKLEGACTSSRIVSTSSPKIIGERINITGKKYLSQGILNRDYSVLVKEAILQVENGADILDINLSMKGIDDSQIVVDVLRAIQEVVDIPLQIDSTNPKTLELASRYYNGKLIINSTSGQVEKMEEILPIVKKYGSGIVGLTLDEDGIPESLEGRLGVARRIIHYCEKYKIPREDIYIDGLALTLSYKPEQVQVSLELLREVKKLGVKTILGISNISFGLVNRKNINRAYLVQALSSGLDLAIIDPMDRVSVDLFYATMALLNIDENSQAYLDRFGNEKKEKLIESEARLSLEEIIIRGRKKLAEEETKRLLKEKNPFEIIENIVIPSLNQVGESYERGDVFLPQLIQAGETVKNVFKVLSLSLDKGEEIYKGKILLATVYGDIHDIGKNIVRTLLENYSFKVIDLGKNVSKEDILETIIEEDIEILGLSALMTTTVKNMEETISYIRHYKKDIKILVGGAVLTEEYAKSIDADYYGRDARQAVKIVEEFFKDKN